MASKENIFYQIGLTKGVIKVNHGGPNADVRHVGDLGNVHADATGEKSKEFHEVKMLKYKLLCFFCLNNNHQFENLFYVQDYAIII